MNHDGPSAWKSLRPGAFRAPTTSTPTDLFAECALRLTTPRSLVNILNDPARIGLRFASVDGRLSLDDLHPTAVSTSSSPSPSPTCPTDLEESRSDVWTFLWLSNLILLFIEFSIEDHNPAPEVHGGQSALPTLRPTVADLKAFPDFVERKYNSGIFAFKLQPPK
uniref:Uncharacterized protein n=1 Tax=Chromera velia CCMP2878 TaxID=1169474 RepID=A0A0G4H1N6_9ALVE|eukprot:Cvel_24327.t1-p1 / transcript=Cvel_24327.t1 / gene=Cvel_24327 / organism=Chromera_velia_CCMP2878 / gene_product=hypothetical protein / transcript_product=hypothetical protein / location=Cvel_scaffold2615:20959-23207(+) / protein_length=164 / sequence_SO=supercontig / SO=protein_coding / is_pseudo=false